MRVALDELERFVQARQGGNRPAPGFPRMKGTRFIGAYPFAQVDFEDESLPLEASLEAFNPLIPLNVDDSALPVVLLRYRLASRS